MYDSDEYFMSRALKLAEKGRGSVSPNPLVGAVIVKDGKIISEGYHAIYGGLHAERVALEKLNYKADGATLYVNLEPCCHWGKTPPCTEAIISSGIKRVVVATVDPNPEVSGRGIEELKRAGLEVKTGVLEDEAKKLNFGFFKWIVKKVPFVSLKWAQSIDGKLATYNGDSKWISSHEARVFAHRLRSIHDAVLVGVNTVLMDDPLLNTRFVEGPSPKKIILDTEMKLNPKSRLFGEGEVIIFTSCNNIPDDFKLLNNVKIEKVAQKKGILDLEEVLSRLGSLGITSVLVEGGGRVISSFLKEGIFDKIYAFIAPRVIGEGGVAYNYGLNFDSLNSALSFLVSDKKFFNDTILLELLPKSVKI